MSVFNVILYKLSLLEDSETQERRVLEQKFVGFLTLNEIAKREQVTVGELPLSALRGKIGAKGEFWLPHDRSIVDDTNKITLYEYGASQDQKLREYRDGTVNIFWVELVAASSSGQPDSPVTQLPLREKPVLLPSSIATAYTIDETSQSGVVLNSQTTRKGPTALDEKDWKYICRANGIFKCSLIDLSTCSIKQAPLLAFGLRDEVDGDYSSVSRPASDVPIWNLTSSSTRSYIVETSSRVEKSAAETGHPEKTIDIGLANTFEKNDGDINSRRYRRVSRSHQAFKKGGVHHTFIVHEVPVIEVSLNRHVVHLSDSCRRALQNLRTRRRFRDLLEFFDNFGTVHSQKLVLGRRLIAERHTHAETAAAIVGRELALKQEASGLLGLGSSQIEGGRSAGVNYESPSLERAEHSFSNLKFRTFRGNISTALQMDTWRGSVNDFRSWAIIQHADVQPIEDFIGGLDGYRDIPELFESIRRSGVYDIDTLLLSHGSGSYINPSYTAKNDVWYSLNTCLHHLRGKPSTKWPFQDLPSLSTSFDEEAIRETVSWQVLDSNAKVYEEICFSQVGSTNFNLHLCQAPAYFQDLTMAPLKVVVLLSWSANSVTTGPFRDFGSGSIAAKVASLKDVYSNTLLQELKAAWANVNMDITCETTMWMDRANAVRVMLNDLMKTMEASSSSRVNCGKGTPIYQWVSDRVKTWNALRKYLEGQTRMVRGTTSEGYATRTTKEMAEARRDTTQNTVAMMWKEIESLATGDLGSEGIVFLKPRLTSEASLLLAQDDPSEGARAFTNEFGHSFIESYTETCTLSAAWTITFSDKLNEVEIQAFGTALKRYLHSGVSVEEACTFFEHGINHLALPDAPPDKVTASVYGYRDPASREPVDLRDIPARRVKYYLTESARQRNRVRISCGLRPFDTIKPTVDTTEENDEKDVAGKALRAFACIDNYVPDERAVLGLQEILTQLCVMDAYERAPEAKVDSDALQECHEKFVALEIGNLLDDEGWILPQAVEALAKLSERLRGLVEKAEWSMLEEK